MGRRRKINITFLGCRAHSLKEDMCMKNRGTFVTMSLIAMSIVVALSSRSYAAHGWYSGLTVTGVVVEPGGPGFSIFTSGSVADCGTPGKFYIDFGRNRAKEMYAAALAALVAARKVTIYVDAALGCSPFHGMQSTGLWVS
jgi:hypothetical protein